MGEHKTYSKAPVVEVMCVLTIDSPDTLTEEQILAFKEKIADDFPEYTESTRKTAPSNTEIKQYKFTSRDESVAVTLFNKVIEYHILKNYTDADKLYAEFGKIYDCYRSVVQVSDIKYSQLGYLNKIVVPHNRINLSDYFTFTPNAKKELVDFIVGYEVEDADKFRTSLSLVPTQSDSDGDSSFILDIRGATPDGGKLPDDFIMILQRLHDNIENEFECAITDNTKKLFEEGR